MISLKLLSSTCYRIKRRVSSSHRVSSSCRRRLMSLANNFPFILWFIGRLQDLDQIFGESSFSLIGESIISIIVEYDLPTTKTWRFCVVGLFLWLIRHNGLLLPEHVLKGVRVLWNKKRNLKPPWPWEQFQTSCPFVNLTLVMVTQLHQSNVFHLYLITRGKRACLCEDMKWKTTKLCDYQCHYEELVMVRIRNTTNHVISCSGSVWNGQRCNRWIVLLNLLSDKNCWIIMDDSRTQNHIKVNESIYPAK